MPGYFTNDCDRDSTCTVVYAVVQRAMGASTSASSFFDCPPHDTGTIKHVHDPHTEGMVSRTHKSLQWEGARAAAAGTLTHYSQCPHVPQVGQQSACNLGRTGKVQARHACGGNARSPWRRARSRPRGSRRRCCRSAPARWARARPCRPRSPRTRAAVARTSPPSSCSAALRMQRHHAGRQLPSGALASEPGGLQLSPRDSVISLAECHAAGVLQPHGKPCN